MVSKRDRHVLEVRMTEACPGGEYTDMMVVCERQATGGAQPYAGARGPLRSSTDPEASPVTG